jgi:hypothetical protein
MHGMHAKKWGTQTEIILQRPGRWFYLPSAFQKPGLRAEVFSPRCSAAKAAGQGEERIKMNIHPVYVVLSFS